MKISSALCLVALCVFASCSSDSGGAFERYLISHSIVTTTDRLKVMTMAAGPSLLSTIRSAEDVGEREGGGWREIAAVSEAFNIIYLRIEPIKELDRTSNPISRSFVASHPISASGLHRLYKDLAGKISLKQVGEQTIAPISYQSFRHIGTARATEFLFYFPKVRNGKRIELSEAFVVIDEFGLNIGRIEHRIKSP